MASKADLLLKAYEKVVSEPWQGGISGKEKVWFLVYDPAEQRKIEMRLEDFKVATQNGGKQWHTISLKGCFAEWMAGQEYRESYFSDPESLIDLLDTEFREFVGTYLITQMEQLENADACVIAVLDVSALFGFARLSDVLNLTAPHLKGRMLVFFPGDFDKNHYRLLQARDGWSYLARPILAEGAGA